MAISPDDARKLNEAELKLISKLECEIDNQLRNCWSGNPLTLYIKSEGLPQRSREELMKRYMNVGWKVILVSINGPGKDQQLELSFSVTEKIARGYHK